MHTFLVKIYILTLVIIAVEKSDCKQGGRQGQQMNAEDFNFYYGAACLSYGHSCWGAHGKRNVDVSNNPDAWFLYRMALMRKSANKETALDQTQSQNDNVPNYFNIFKTYIQKDLKKINSNEAIDAWDIPPNKYIPNGRYYEDQVLDPRIQYKLMKI